MKTRFFFIAYDDIKKTFMISLICILCIAWIFSIKSFRDNRTGQRLGTRMGEIQESIDNRDKSLSKAELDKLYDEMEVIRHHLMKIYGFPKIFFFFFLILLFCTGFWSFSLCLKIPENTPERYRSSIRLILVLFTLLITIICFLALEYHKIYRSGWVYLLLIIQWLLIAISATNCSDEVYKKISEITKDKSIIEGDPPSAW
jgi:hypothetical protein